MIKKDALSPPHCTSKVTTCHLSRKFLWCTSISQTKMYTELLAKMGIQRWPAQKG